MYAWVDNQWACWVYTGIPLSMSTSLPWHISPASVSNWTWLQHQWNSSHPLWNVTWTDIDSGVKQWYDRPRPLVDYSTWDGSGGLTVEANGAGPWSWIAPLCIENLKGQVWVCRTLTGLCQTPTLKHTWEMQSAVWAAVPNGALWVCSSHGSHAVLYNVLVPYWLCVHLLYKEIGAYRCATPGLRRGWIAWPLNKGMSGLPRLHEFSSICLNSKWISLALKDWNTGGI